MKNDLIVLMGTTSVGKSAVARALEHTGIVRASHAEMLRELYPHQRIYNPTEVQRSYEALGEHINDLLLTDSVVIPEWFYLPGSYDAMVDKIDPAHNRHQYHILATREEVLRRNQCRMQPIDDEFVLKHYGLTHEQPGEAYVKLMPMRIDTTYLFPETTAGLVLVHSGLESQRKND